MRLGSCHKAPSAGLIVFISSILLLTSSPAMSHNITFNTDFANSGAGPGTILDQSAVNAARIFQYTENDVFATAIRDLDAESHYHLFGNGIVIGGDSEGVRFTFGGPNPTTPFNVESLEVLELGTTPTFFTPFIGSTAGPASQVTSTGLFNFDPNAWSGVSHFVASFDTPLPGAGARLVFTNLDLHQAENAPVPEPSTFGLFGMGFASLWYLRRKKQQAGA